MKTLHLIYPVIAVSVLTGTTGKAAVRPILGAVKEVISFGLDVYSFFDSILGKDETHSTPAPIDYDRIINRISERIKLSTETIVFKIELQAYLSELRNVALTVEELLAEMERIVQARNKDKREALQSLFRNNFERHKTEIYKVKRLLTFSVDVSGISGTLLSLIAKELKCGITSLEEFQDYYMALVSDVVALALLNERLSEISLYNETIDSWQTAIKSLFDDMEAQKSDCKAKFFELAKDFSRINDPAELLENFQNKYSYLDTDVLYLSGSYCVWSLKAYDKILKKVKDNTMTFAFMSGKENVQSLTSKQFQKVVSVAEFENCLDDTDTTKVISYFDGLGKDLVFWLMYPQEQAAEFQILLDQDSTASKITTETDGIKYTTIVYLRTQDHSTSAFITPDDFDVKFYEKDVTVDESSGLKAWQVFFIICGSFLAFHFLICICFCCFYCFFRVVKQLNMTMYAISHIIACIACIA
ncbi:uncharacterized protein LOC128554842 [Mercenaria mercenaria]|uniref:uncharacterized protein LOC128554842 n=1 Tax=Mercenaria mercenaria TaxID=6596 RepID=UPI00234F561B|nr:uncharacterized protein LOC128554842 [Mercenaria mercenaria]